MSLPMLQATQRLLIRRRVVAHRRSLAPLPASPWSATGIPTNNDRNTISSIRHFATGTRGARGHGWFTNYRAGKGGRHLQGEYYEHESIEEQFAWNQAVLALGYTDVSMQVKVFPKAATSSDEEQSSSSATTTSSTGAIATTAEPLAVHTLSLRLATAVMPETTRNFIDLLLWQQQGTNSDSDAATSDATSDSDASFGYKGSSLYRLERNVGLCGGDILTNTGRAGRPSLAALQAARDAHDNDSSKSSNNSNIPRSHFENLLSLPIQSDPLALWHVPGTVSMLVSMVGEVDSRFLLNVAAAPHMNGIHRAIGVMSEESRAMLEQLMQSTLTRNGVPMNVSLIIGECRVVGEGTVDDGGRIDAPIAGDDNGSNNFQSTKKSATASG